MPKSVSTTEAKKQFSALINWIEQSQDEVIVERRGRPRAVIISMAEYEVWTEFKKRRAQREETIRRLRDIQSNISARNSDLSEDEADELAIRFSRELWDELAEQRTRTPARASR